MANRKLILYIACSLDGYIAKPGDDLSFLDRVATGGEDYGYQNFISSVDTIIIGRKTYDWVVGKVGAFPQEGKETFVVTRTPRPAEGKINFYSGSLHNLVSSLKKSGGLNIFCDGGAEIVNELLSEKLIDELILSVVPVLLGDGIKLFKDSRPGQELKLQSIQKFDTGLVQLHYKIVR
jgi:dihydrofolate reductase